MENIEKKWKYNTRIFFEKANDVRLHFKLKHTMLRRQNGTLLTENEKIAKALKNMF